MKKLPMIPVLVIMFIACNDEKKPEEVSEKPKVKVEFPYKAEYSPEFSVGNPNHSKIVLDLYKMWEDGKIDEMKPLLADSIFIEVYDGFRFNNTLDSCISLLKQIRATYKSIKPVFDTWMPIHHNETNEDYVLVWNRDYYTTSEGKEDSLRVHAYFQIKDNKVRGWSEFQQKLASPPPPPPPAKK